MCASLDEDICELEKKDLLRLISFKFPFIPASHIDRIKEASKGYYTDLNAVRKHGGKTWIAPKTLIREDVGIVGLEPVVLFV